jgi:hypothetical protein
MSEALNGLVDFESQGGLKGDMYIDTQQGIYLRILLSHIPGANWPSGGSSDPSFRVRLVCNRLFAVCLLICPFSYLYNTRFLPLDI